MINGIQIDEGLYGRRAVVTGAWSAEIGDYLLENGIVDLELNSGKGWRGNDISFLDRLPNLMSLTIIDLRIQSVEPVNSLHELRMLELITYCQTEIRFSNFPSLEECALEWRAGAASLFDCGTLKRLFVDHFDGGDVSQFGRLANLQSLAILNAPIKSLLGLRSLTKLRNLRLANLRKLTSLSGIERLKDLEDLEVHTCRSIHSIEEIGLLPQLKRLYLNNDGDIDTIKPLANLRHLETVLFYESTNILDGDLSPLLLQRNLSRISFQNRRHYSQKREDFGVAYSR